MKKSIFHSPHSRPIIRLHAARLEDPDRRSRGRPRVMEFHISRACRDTYSFDDALFTASGNVVFPDFHAVRLFAYAMNTRRDLAHHPEKAVRAGQLNAMGLIDEILHYVVELYREQVHGGVMADALAYLEKRLGGPVLDQVLATFADEFPTVSAYREQIPAAEYLRGRTGGVSHREIVLEEMMMLWLANLNPAFASFAELFDDERLREQTAYPEFMEHLQDFFSDQPPFGPDDDNLIDLLRRPAREHPHSLTAQLGYMREKWGILLQKYLLRLLSGLDLVREEEKMGFHGPGPTRVMEFGVTDSRTAEAEPERFSPDLHWMPRVVLIAKCTFVWLDQLSRQYGRPMERLDQIPDEELDRLARWGFTGLWLIGLWERSRASRTIKQLCGNPEALASAYSLLDYRVSDELGGEAALDNLRQRAWQRGIRLAGDMVPNHMGIDSPWLVDHPDWFIQLDHPPYPAYSFGGMNLSADDRVGIYLEDHYYDRSDAAVVFRLEEHGSGRTRYVYHGNDGTSMPWNDTAQLNYLLPEVREAVIRTILDVARRFPIIRFDAAMTLTKRHYQRLWFPEPGSGGDIPTRADKGMSREEFNRHMPEEFWREVVDRVAAEAPDTLLLAEAFWLMEGYFVRSLGMHRVYNSAFMNMLKNEENQKFRYTIKNVLEFNPEILKRFVNFMNNPDEDTAVAQFGRGDKNTGVAVLMGTLPGLPMFGHGQVEGYAEKYGMEYKRAYWDEQPDDDLIWRHERFISPLLHRRHLFAEVQDFFLYDFFTPHGGVNEDVFAYSNRSGDQRGLVLYHNKYASTEGWIRMSVAYSVPRGDDGERELRQRSLGEALGLPNEPDCFVIFRDHVQDLEYIRKCRDIHEQGLFVSLGAYQYQVFLDFRIVHDDAGQLYRKVFHFLEGRGVSSLDQALRNLYLQPLHRSLERLLEADFSRRLLAARPAEPGTPVDRETLNEFEQRQREFLALAARFAGGKGNGKAVARTCRSELDTLLQLPLVTLPEPVSSPLLRDFLRDGLAGDPAAWPTLFGWLVCHRLGQPLRSDFSTLSLSLLDEFSLAPRLVTFLQRSGLDEAEAARRLTLLRSLVEHQHRLVADLAERTPHQLLADMLEDPALRDFLAVNRHEEQLWFNRESFKDLCVYLFTISTVQLLTHTSLTPLELANRFQRLDRILHRWLETAPHSEYKVDQLLELLADTSFEGE